MWPHRAGRIAVRWNLPLAPVDPDWSKIAFTAEDNSMGDKTPKRPPKPKKPKKPA
jgi:hypothetical protein